MVPEPAIAFQNRIVTPLSKFLEVWISYRQGSVASEMNSLHKNKQALDPRDFHSHKQTGNPQIHTILMKINSPVIFQFSSFGSLL